MKMMDREKMIKELQAKDFVCDGMIHICDIADFILADRKRIVEPLVRKYPKGLSNYEYLDVIQKACRQAIKNAGITG